jgi:undecaprenyl diphosphate synthase
MTVITPGMPRHVAIIMDGNGRWAARRGLPRSAGHMAGFDRIHSVVSTIHSLNIPYLTIFSFSTENWDRPEDEVQGIIKILADNISAEAADLHRQGIRMRHIGRLSDLTADIQESILKGCELTRQDDGMVFTFAFNYGGRMEILEAVKGLMAEGYSPEQIDETLFEKHLYTAGIPPVDLLIRTGGELRLSNFMLWQAAYAELYFTRTLWPDFTPKRLEKALNAFTQRQRRFGKIA